MQIISFSRLTEAHMKEMGVVYSTKISLTKLNSTAQKLASSKLQIRRQAGIGEVIERAASAIFEDWRVARTVIVFDVS